MGAWHVIASVKGEEKQRRKTKREPKTEEGMMPKEVGGERWARQENDPDYA